MNDLSGVLEKAKAAGGRVVFPLPDDPTGRSAEVFDPSGTRLGLCAVDGAAWAPKVLSAEPGQIVWLEDKTRDEVAANDFYCTVFGSAVGETDSGKARLLRNPTGPSYAAVMQLDDRWAADCPPHWLMYVRVENLDATIEKALAVGGSLWFERTETPLGPLAYLRDPEGNAFSVVEVAEAAHERLFVWSPPD